MEKCQLFGQVGDERLVDAQHVEVLEHADAARYHLDRIDLVVDRSRGERWAAGGGGW